MGHDLISLAKRKKNVIIVHLERSYIHIITRQKL